MNSLSPERWQQVDALFERALDLGVAERKRFLEQIADSDERRSVERLLSAAAPHFLEGDAFEFAAPLLPAAEPADESAAAPGDQIGPYRIVSEIGRGGMGEVYLAEREQPFQQTVAVKVMRCGIGRDEGARFVTEQQALAELNHPHIARLLDGGVTEDGRPYFAMDIVEGETLTHYADARRLSVDVRLALFLDVCSAVHHAHQNFILHRDLKPGNILVTEDGRVKLLDFGIAKILAPHGSGTPLETRTALRAMTLEYASPEQIQGAALTTAADVYSLGVVLYELLVGHRPYRLTRNTPDELIKAVCEQVPTRPSTAALPARATGADASALGVAEARSTTPQHLRRSLRGDLDAIVLKALRKETAQRYGSVEQLMLDLERYRAHQPVLAHRGSRRYRLARFVRRRRTELLAGAVVALALVGGAGVAVWQASMARAEQEAAEVALAQSEAVRGILAEVLAASDPVEGQGIQSTMSNLLVQGVGLANGHPDQPLVQAEVFATIGRVYSNLGEYDRAQPLFERALRLRRAVLGSHHPEVAEALIGLGHAHRGFGRYADADALFRKALAIQRAHPNLPRPVLVETLRLLGGTSIYLTDLVGAAAYYREAIALDRAAPGPDLASLGETTRLLANVARRQGKNDQALALFRTSLALRRQAHGDVHPETANARFHLGDELVHAGREDEAVVEFEEGMRVLRVDSSHPLQLVHGIHSLASVHARRGNLAEAEKLYRESLALHRQHYGAGAVKYGYTLNMLGDFLVDVGRYDEAGALHGKALAIYESRFGPSHRAVLSGRVAIANLWVARGDLDRAEAVLREVVVRRVQEEAPGSLMVAGSQEALADVLVLRGRLDEAEVLYQKALALRDSVQVDGHGDKQRILAALAKIYKGRGDIARAERYRGRLSSSSHSRKHSW